MVWEVAVSESDDREIAGMEVAEAERAERNHVVAGEHLDVGSPAFSGQLLKMFLCCCLPVQVLVVDLLRCPVAES